jgi:transporter family protein
MPGTANWLVWALLSAVFAALTAIFAKVGVQGVDADLATLIRTAIVVVLLVAFVGLSGKWRNPVTIPTRTWVFLTLSALATGASWLCYFRALQLGDAARVAPVDKLSVVLIALFATAFLAERLSLRDWGAIVLISLGVLNFALER